MEPPPSPRLLNNRLAIHDRRAFELKLEYQPSGQDPRSRFRVEMFMFLPASLNVDHETCPRQTFYRDIHNYVRLKTPMLEVAELLCAERSPLVRAEQLGGAQSHVELVYQAKLLACMFRGGMRRFARMVEERCLALAPEPGSLPQSLAEQVDGARQASLQLLERFRTLSAKVARWPGVEERTHAALRLVEEYLSLTLEQIFRRTVALMDGFPRNGAWAELRRALMAEIIREEDQRRRAKLQSVLSPHGDNEEYLHRVGVLKKFTQNILFLRVRRQPRRQGWEEVLFAIAAGVAMAIATGIAFWAQLQFTQVSLNFFLILVVGYMMKDRLKEGMRRILSKVAAQYLFDRTTTIADPVTSERIGVCKERVDYLRPGAIPQEIAALRQADDLATVAHAELTEVVIHYQKEVVLDAEDLAQTSTGSAGVTDIIRWNVERLLRDMDDPELALEYVDLEDLAVGRVRAAKAYRVDVAFRYGFDDGDLRGTRVELFRMVLDRNGIKRIVRREDEGPPTPAPVRQVA